MQVMQAVRAAAGPEIMLRADANRGWDLDDAIKFGCGVRAVGLQFIEEPVKGGVGLSDFFHATGKCCAHDALHAQAGAFGALLQGSKGWSPRCRYSHGTG